MTWIRRARIKSLKKYYKNLFMDEDNLFLDFFGKHSCMVYKLQSLEEVITNAELVAKLLQSASSKFDVITTSIEKFQDLETITLEDVIGTLKVQEDKFKARLVKRKEIALLAKALIKDKKKLFDSSNSRGQGKGHGRGRSRRTNRSNEDDEDEKPKYKSKSHEITFKMHFANQCRNPKKYR